MAPGAAAAGLAVDALVGDPPDELHPVAWFGRAMTSLESALYGDSRGRGAAYTAAGLAAGLVAGRIVPAGVAASVAVGGRGLAGAARRVGDAVAAGDLDRAREALPWLVGRDPSGLGADEICRAVVESVAENTVDAVVAPALWTAVGGGPGALAHRALNTMDAMVGHRSARYSRFGWASARADDAANWVPARATALLVASVRPSSAVAVLRTVRADAPAHPSPNAGVAEAAFAAALGVRLGGTNRYGDVVEHRPVLGDGPLPGPGDVDRAVRLSRDVTLALGAMLAVWAGARRRLRTSR